MNKKEIIIWIDKRIEESMRFLDDNNTDYDSVLNNEDSTDYSELCTCEVSENNNFEAGIISGLLELKKELIK